MPKVTSVSGCARPARSRRDDFAETVDRLDDVVGGEDGDDGVADRAAASTAAPKPTALSVSRPHGSPRNCSRASRGKRRADRPRACDSAGADEAVGRRAQASSRATAISSRLRPPMNGINCLGSAGAAHRPQPRARAAGDDQCVSHIPDGNQRFSLYRNAVYPAAYGVGSDVRSVGEGMRSYGWPWFILAVALPLAAGDLKSFGAGRQ